MIDVVYPLGSGSAWDNNELRYSLRSLEKNLLDLGRVFVVGQRPDWLVEAMHIPMEDVHRKNKDANLIDKVLAACRAGVSDRFVRLSDDQCLLQPRSSGQMQAYHLGPLDQKPASFWGVGRWKRRLRRTYALLLHEGLPTLHYDSHIPMVYQRDRFVEVMTRWPLRSQTPPGRKGNWPGGSNTLVCHTRLDYNAVGQVVSDSQEHARRHELRHAQGRLRRRHAPARGPAARPVERGPDAHAPPGQRDHQHHRRPLDRPS